MTFKPGWTVERIATLKRLQADGLTCSQIAAKLGGVSRNAVIGKLHREGISGGPVVRKPKSARPTTVNKQFDGIANRVRRNRHNATHLLAIAGELDPGFTDIPTINDTQIPIEQRKTLDQLDATTCRWPVGDPQSKEFFFCGAQPKDSSPYCTGHHRIAYHPRREITEDERARGSASAKCALHGSQAA